MFGLVLLGVIAGFITTLTGLGGGVFLLIVLAWALGPHQALAVSALALIVGNLHRLYLYRRLLNRPIAGRVALGVVPGALLGGLWASRLPESWIHAFMLAMVGLALLRKLIPGQPTMPRQALAPAGFAIGAAAGAAGGAGVLVSPLLLASGLRGDAYLACAAFIAIAMHLSRVLAYGAGGLMSEATVTSSAVLAIGIPFGNFIADKVRGWIGERAVDGLAYASLVVCAGLAVAGVS